MANIKAYAKLEDLFKDAVNLTNNNEFDLGLPIEENGTYIFTKTIDVPYTTWHYDDHKCAIEVKAVNEDNNTGPESWDTKTREDYLDNSNYDGLFRAKELNKPTATISSRDSEGKSFSIASLYTHKEISILEIVGEDKADAIWYKNSGIKDNDNGSLKSLSKFEIFKDGNTNINLFDSSKLSRIDQEDQSVKWIYGIDGDPIFEDGTWTINFQISDNDENVTEVITKTFIVDTTIPELQLDKDIPATLNTKTYVVKGKTDPNISVVITTKGLINGQETISTATGESKNDGSFEITISLFEGNNIITILVQEESGRTNSMSLETTVDTSIPVIEQVSLSSASVEIGSNKLIITVKVRI